MAADDFIMTIDSDVEDALPEKLGGKSQLTVADDAVLNAEFSFEVEDNFPSTSALDHLDGSGETNGSRAAVSIDDIIARRRATNTAQKRKRAAEEEDESEASSNSAQTDEEEDEDNDGEPVASSDEDDEEDVLATSDEEDANSVNGNDDKIQEEGSSSEDDEETLAESERKAAFFDDSLKDARAPSSFLTMNLSRPLLKALTSLGFNTPTPIQAATIPVALMGKDIVGNAVTGSGKTAAFIIPMLERLLYREKGKKAAATRCLVLVPTRELGVQCFEVGKKLSAHTDIQFCLAVGGLSVKVQEAALRTRPDVVIATPGRLIDHIRNSPAFTLDALDILVLDEADRMLSDGFADELAEIIKSCPPSRQTMLFSATMTDSVDELVRMSLNKPARLFVDPKRSTARGLVQEFVRIRAGKDAERTAVLVALCKKTFRTGVIIFFRSKKLAHQVRVAFSLLDLKSDELHGDLTQEQRLRALQAFRDRQVDYLMATDLASRGLDIKGVETVINFDMPSQLAQYLHRVGRTARAGKKGKSVTLVGEGDRKMLKAVIKHSSDQDNVRHRVLPADLVSQWATELDSLKDEVSEIMQEEKQEKQMRNAERDIKKGQNIIEHRDEIMSRPARTWFQSEKDKANSQAISKRQYEDGGKITDSKSTRPSNKNVQKPKRDKLSGLTRRAKRRKLALMEDNEAGTSAAVSAAIRAAKKGQRPVKIGEAQPSSTSSKRARSKSKKSSTRKPGFERDLGQPATREGARVRKGDAIGSGKRKGLKKRH